MRAFILAAAGVLVFGALPGCDSEQAQVNLHEPGKYSGAIDPLLAKTQGGKNDEAMKKRFLMIQTDR